MLQKMPTPFKTALEAAIAHLAAQNIIKSSADVARDLGLSSRSTVSAYASGRTKMSNNFRTLFENKYGLKLKDFEQFAEKQEIQEDEPDPSGHGEADLLAMYRQQMEVQRLFLEKIERLNANFEKLGQAFEDLRSMYRQQMDAPRNQMEAQRTLLERIGRLNASFDKLGQDFEGRLSKGATMDPFEQLPLGRKNPGAGGSDPNNKKDNAYETGK